MADEDKVGKTKRYVNAACEALGISPTTFLSAGLEKRLGTDPDVDGGRRAADMEEKWVEVVTALEQASASNRVAVALLVRGFIEAELARIPK